VNVETYLRELLKACHAVLPHLTERNDKLAEAIRETCREIEIRLGESEPDTLAPEVR
jgi:hypothetical protein